MEFEFKPGDYVLLSDIKDMKEHEDVLRGFEASGDVSTLDAHYCFKENNPFADAICWVPINYHDHGHEKMFYERSGDKCRCIRRLYPELIKMPKPPSWDEVGPELLDWCEALIEYIDAIPDEVQFKKTMPGIDRDMLDEFLYKARKIK